MKDNNSNEDNKKKKINTSKFLPIGTVVSLKGKNNKLMITGFLPAKNGADSKDLFDYCAVWYPVGTITMQYVLVFNHEQIDKIYHMGLYDDPAQKVLQEELKKILSKIKTDRGSF